MEVEKVGGWHQRSTCGAATIMGNSIYNLPQAGSLAQVKAAVDNHADVNCEDEHGDTTLHLACKTRKGVIVEYLLSLPNIEVDKTNQDGETPLDLAYDYGNTEAVRLILSKLDSKLEFSLEDLNKKEVLESYINNGQPEMVEKVLKHWYEQPRSTSNFSSEVEQFEGFLQKVEEIKLPKLNDVESKEKTIKNRQKTIACHLLSLLASRCPSPSQGSSSGASNPPNQSGEAPLSQNGKMSPSQDRGAANEVRVAAPSKTQDTSRTPSHIGEAPPGPNGLVSQSQDRVASPTQDQRTSPTEGRPTEVSSSLLLNFVAMCNHVEIIRSIVKWQLEWDVNALSKTPGLNSDDVATPLHVATMCGNVEFVRELCIHPKLRASTEDKDDRTPLEIAVRRGKAEIEQLLKTQDKSLASSEGTGTETDKVQRREDHLEKIENLLMERREVTDFVKRMYRDRQVYVDAANALLVGAALIASVTFPGWLQPPLSYIQYSSTPNPFSPLLSENCAAVNQHKALRAFWWFNSLSFFFAISTVLAGAYAAMPYPQHIFIRQIVESAKKWLIRASFLLAISVGCVLGAFATAGFAVLPPIWKFYSSMVTTVVLGGFACIVILGLFIRNLFLLAFGTKETNKQSKKIQSWSNLCSLSSSHTDQNSGGNK